MNARPDGARSEVWYPDIRIDRLDAVGQFGALHEWHHDIGEEEVEGAFLGDPKHEVAQTSQCGPSHRPNILVVVYDEDQRRVRVGRGPVRSTYLRSSWSMSVCFSHSIFDFARLDSSSLRCSRRRARRAASSRTSRSVNVACQARASASHRLRG
jgi:hypothetical protein